MAAEKIQIVDQLRIIKGEIAPPNFPLVDLVSQLFLRKAYELKYNGLDSENELSQPYISKMKVATDRIIDSHNSNLTMMMRCTVIALGDVYSLPVIEGSDDATWEQKIEAVLDDAIVKFAKITEQERADFNDIS